MKTFASCTTTNPKFLSSISNFASRLTTVLMIVALALVALPATPAHAASFVVANNNDSGAGSLRQAILDANANGAGSDTITFAGNYTITLGSQLPAVTTQITITGNGAANTIIQANAVANTAIYRVFRVAATGNLTLDGVTVRNGRCTGPALPGSCEIGENTGSGGGFDSVMGGGILNYGALTVTNSLISANRAGSCGGIYSVNGSLTVTGSTIDSNTLPAGGTGVGICAHDSSTTISNNTFSNNVGSSWAGGLFAVGSLGVTKNTTITNNTFVGNTAGIGGGLYTIFHEPLYPVVVANNTFYNNNGIDATGGLFVHGYIRLMNNTFSGNLGAAPYGQNLHFQSAAPTPTVAQVFSNNIIANSPNGRDCILESSSITTSSNNLIEATGANACGLVNGVNGNIIGSDPLLNAAGLQNNGGPTQTFALQALSPAINTGSNATCLAAPVNNLDQRGVARPQGSTCDIGAFEAVSYTVTYALNGGVLAPLPTQANVLTGGTFSVYAGTAPTKAGYNFVGWNDGTTTYAAGALYTMGISNVTLTAVWTLLPPTTLVNSILPTSRSIQTGTLATVFSAVINSGANPAIGVTLSMASAPAGTFSYLQTSCATNAIIGGSNPSLDIPAGETRCYVLSFTPSATFAATSVQIQAQASNAPATSLFPGVNTWLLRSTATPEVDIIGLTTTTDFHQISCIATNVFAVALANVGVAAVGDITVTANTGTAVLPLTFLIQETTPATGVIIGTNVLSNVLAGQNRSVAVFVVFNGCVNFDPAANRIFIEFKDANGNVVGSTSTAVSTGR